MTTTMKKKARGQQDSWFAVTSDTHERLPCVFKEYWTHGNQYHDPYFYDPSKSRNREYVDAIKNGKRVLVTSNVLIGRRHDGANKWKRGPYVEAFEIDNVSSSEDGLRFTFVKRKRNT
jgi:hypothetical protein